MYLPVHPDAECLSHLTVWWTHAPGTRTFATLNSYRLSTMTLGNQFSTDALCSNDENYISLYGYAPDREITANTKHIFGTAVGVTD